MKKITIYTTRFCGYCNAAKKWLEQKGWNIRKYVFTKETKWKNSRSVSGTEDLTPNLL